jgi:hypothetical protein
VSVQAPNAAERLYSLLREYGAEPNRSIGEGWANALGVSVERVPYHLGEVLALFREVRERVDAAGLPVYEPVPSMLQTLLGCIYVQGTGFDARVGDRPPSPDAMKLLGLLTTGFPTNPLDAEPDTDELAELLAEVDELIKGVREANLAESIRSLLLDRLFEVARALSHLKVGGADAVRRATESLASSVAVLAPAAPAETASIMDKVKKFAVKTYGVVTVVSVLMTAGLSADKLVDLPLITQGSEQPTPVNPPPDPAPPTPADGDELVEEVTATVEPDEQG